MNKELHRVLRYLIVGTYNAGAGYLIFYLINRALAETLHYLVILVLSYFLSLTHAYIGQRLIVFRSTVSWKKEYFRFLLVNLYGMGCNALLLFLFVESGMRVLMAQAISVVIVAALSYFGHRYFSFRSA